MAITKIANDFIAIQTHRYNGIRTKVTTKDLALKYAKLSYEIARKIYRLYDII